MAKIAQKVLNQQFNSLPKSFGKSATSSVMLQEQESKWEAIIDSDLEEWLIRSDEPSNCFGDSSLQSNEPELTDGVLQNVNDFNALENDYWLEEFPLFEEIQYLDDIKIQSNPDSQNGLPSLNDATGLPSPLQTLFGSSKENATLVFSNENLVFIKSDPQLENYSNVLFTKGETLDKDLNVIAKSPKSCENESCPMNVIYSNPAIGLDQWESDTTGSEMSSDASASSGSTFESPILMQEDESDDPDWKPKLRKPMAMPRCQKAKYQRSKTSSIASCRGETLEDKRQRKKEQNKYAATRYRLKKKAEISELLREEEELKQKKVKLEEKVVDLSNEIKCLKGLMRDFFKVRGLL